MTAPIVFKIKKGSVVASPSGGNGLFHNNGESKWFNETDKRIELRFTKFDGGPPSAVWPFGATPPPTGVVFDPTNGIVCMDEDRGFTAPVSAAALPLYVKYTADVVPPDPSIDKLDPIIIIDR